VWWVGARVPPDNGRADPPGHLQEQQGAPEDQEEPQAEVLDRSLPGTVIHSRDIEFLIRFHFASQLRIE